MRIDQQRTIDFCKPSDRQDQYSSDQPGLVGCWSAWLIGLADQHIFWEDQQIFLAHRLILLAEQHLFLADQRIGLADLPGLSIVHPDAASILTVVSLSSVEPAGFLAGGFVEFFEADTGREGSAGVEFVELYDNGLFFGIDFQNGAHTKDGMFD